MIRDIIYTMITSAAAALQERGILEIPNDGIPSFDVERPKSIEHGDYATNLAMKLARPPKSREIAQHIASYLNEVAELVPAYEMIDKVEVAGPGFINIRLKLEWLLQQAQTIINSGQDVGAMDIGKGQRINLEYLSANPTGPVHIGNGRGGFIGDTLGNALRAAGYEVTKEYYFNDFGNQINKLGNSIGWYMQLALGGKDAQKPEEGYFDNDDDPADTYYKDIAKHVLEESQGQELLTLTSPERERAIGKAATSYIMEDIKRTLGELNIDFDVWFNERSLGESGKIKEGIAILRERGYLYEQDNALWMETTKFGDDKDRVLIKADGNTTYVSSDLAYLRDKFGRGFERLIFVLGADHHGYISRLKATAQMLGYPSDKVHVILYQTVSLKVDGQVKRMAKRLGTLVTLNDLIKLVGSDVTRFFYMMRASDTHLEFDLDLAAKEGDDNPGLSVQYGHARTAGVLRKNREAGFDPEAEAYTANMGILLQDSPEQLKTELTLIRELLRLEEIIERIALTLEPHHLTKYGMDVATAFHIFYDRCPMLRAESAEIRAARYALTIASRTVLARILTLLGMSIPDRMEKAD
jgi:arginyl-tRNA synthetase